MSYACFLLSLVVLLTTDTRPIGAEAFAGESRRRREGEDYLLG